LNGSDISASPSEKVITFEKVGKGEIDQDTLASWLRSHSRF
jgi:prophage maintenance system killer protein